MCIIHKEIEIPVEVPVYKNIDIMVERPVYIENIIEKPVPYEKVVEKEIEVPVEHLVEKPVYIDNIIRKEVIMHGNSMVILKHGEIKKLRKSIQCCGRMLNSV